MDRRFWDPFHTQSNWRARTCAIANTIILTPGESLGSPFVRNQFIQLHFFSSQRNADKREKKKFTSSASGEQHLFVYRSQKQSKPAFELLACNMGAKHNGPKLTSSSLVWPQSMNNGQTNEVLEKSFYSFVTIILVTCSSTQHMVFYGEFNNARRGSPV